MNDPSYAAAVAVRDLVTMFYDLLGGEKGSIDFAKLETTEPTDGTPTGITYFLGNLRGQKGQVTVTNAEPKVKFMAALNKLIKVNVHLILPVAK